MNALCPSQSHPAVLPKNDKMRAMTSTATCTGETIFAVFAVRSLDHLVCLHLDRRRITKTCTATKLAVRSNSPDPALMGNGRGPLHRKVSGISGRGNKQKGKSTQTWTKHVRGSLTCTICLRETTFYQPDMLRLPNSLNGSQIHGPY